MKNGSLFNLSNEILEDGPLVSIVVPVYDTPEGPLRRCLGSILTQDYGNIEVIVVDDGSHDDCIDVLNSICTSDSRVRLVNGAHGGVSHARNMGIEASTGEWIAFCDSDDEVRSCFISEGLEVALSCGADLVCGGVDWLFEGDSVREDRFRQEYCVVDESSDLLAAAMQMLGTTKYAGFAGPDFKGRTPHAKLFSKECLGDLRYNEGISIGEDVLFNYGFIKLCRGLAIVDACWYIYYQYQVSSLHSADLELWKSSIAGALSSRTQGESRIPFDSRCAALSAEAIGAFARARGIRGSYRNGRELLAFVGNLGCYSNDCFRGFLPSLWLCIFTWLCKKGFYGVACCYWAAKTLVKDCVTSRRLIDLNTAVASPGGDS